MILVSISKFLLCIALGIMIGFCGGVYNEKLLSLRPGERKPYGYLISAVCLSLVVSGVVIAFTAFN